MSDRREDKFRWKNNHGRPFDFLNWIEGLLLFKLIPDHKSSLIRFSCFNDVIKKCLEKIIYLH